MLKNLSPTWKSLLTLEMEKPYFQALEQFVDSERKEHSVFPPESDVFNAFAVEFDAVKVVLLGQDPYHGEGQAHGLCFSVQRGIKLPPSLANMFKELHSDLGHPISRHGNLECWADQGVLLLNTVLTVRAHEANSHKNRGWESFTDAVIQFLNNRIDPIVFVLWGGHAHKKEVLIDSTRHRVLKAAHPSPLSARKFFGSRPYSSINSCLKTWGKAVINWQLPD